MRVPDHLYLYQSFAKPYSLENLRNYRIWLANPGSFNDLYDCNPPINSKGSKVKEWKARHIRANMPNVYQVACFSERNDNTQMWSHYADYHQGFCIEFSTAKLPFSNAVQVQYTDNPLEADEADLEFETEGLEKLMLKMILVKSTDWVGEEEWRIVHRIPMWSYFAPQGEGLPYSPDCITAIYLGAAIGPSEEVQIRDILDKWPRKDIFKMKPSEDEFRLISERLYW